MQDVYLEYEKKTYEKLINSIEALPSRALQAVLKSFFAKIYKRQNKERIIEFLYLMFRIHGVLGTCLEPDYLNLRQKVSL